MWWAFLSASLETTIKTCTKCNKIYKDVEVNFKKDRTKSDGFYSSCKNCNHKDWEDNYPKIAEKHREKSKRYAENNIDKVRAYRKRHYQENAIERRQKTREWCKSNPEQTKLNKKAYKQRRRAILAQVENTLTRDDIKRQYDNQNGRCYYCKKKVGLNYHVDHVLPLALGGDNTSENIVIACPFCNVSKGYKTIQEFAFKLF